MMRCGQDYLFLKNCFSNCVWFDNFLASSIALITELRRKIHQFYSDSTQIYNCSCLLKFRSMNKVEAPLKPHQPVWSTRIVTITLALFYKKKYRTNFSHTCWCACYCHYVCKFYILLLACLCNIYFLPVYLRLYIESLCPLTINLFLSTLNINWHYQLKLKIDINIDWFARYSVWKSDDAFTGLTHCVFSDTFAQKV